MRARCKVLVQNCGGSEIVLDNDEVKCCNNAQSDKRVGVATCRNVDGDRIEQPRSARQDTVNAAVVHLTEYREDEIADGHVGDNEQHFSPGWVDDLIRNERPCTSTSSVRITIGDERNAQ